MTRACAIASVQNCIDGPPANEFSAKLNWKRSLEGRGGGAGRPRKTNNCRV